MLSVKTRVLKEDILTFYIRVVTIYTICFSIKYSHFYPQFSDLFRVILAINIRLFYIHQNQSTLMSKDDAVTTDFKGVIQMDLKL
jgi:hypothetical protein